MQVLLCAGLSYAFYHSWVVAVPYVAWKAYLSGTFMSLSLLSSGIRGVQKNQFIAKMMILEGGYIVRFLYANGKFMDVPLSSIKIEDKVVIRG